MAEMVTRSNDSEVDGKYPIAEKETQQGFEASLFDLFKSTPPKESKNVSREVTHLSKTWGQFLSDFDSLIQAIASHSSLDKAALQSMNRNPLLINTSHLNSVIYGVKIKMIEILAQFEEDTLKELERKIVKYPERFKHLFRLALLEKEMVKLKKMMDPVLKDRSYYEMIEDYLCIEEPKMACIVAGKIEDPHAKNQGIILITNGLNAQGYDLKRWEDLVEDLEEGEVRDHIRLKILALHVEGREIELAKQMLSKIKTKYSKDCAIYELCIYLADKGRIQEIPLEEILEMANPSYIPVYICNSHSSLEEKDDFFEQLSLKFLEKEKLDLAFQYAGLIANSSKREKVRLCLFNDYCRFFPLDQVYERLMTLQDQPEFGSLVSGVCQFYCEKGNLHDQEQVNNFIRKVNRHV